MFKLKLKSLLSRKLYEREAQNLKFLKSKPRFSLGLRRLTIISIFSLFLLGYQPFDNFPPKKASVLASELPIQQEKITAEAMPELKLPFEGYLSTPYSRWHPGIDIATGYGTPVHPITNGVVEEASFSFWGYGNYVLITHISGLKSLYGHMDKIYVKKGQAVSVLDTLGTVGLTGFTSGPHTHLEIYKDGQTIDPISVLPEIEKYPKSQYLNPYGGNQNGLQNTTISSQTINVKTNVETLKSSESPKPIPTLPFTQPTPDPKILPLIKL